MARAIGLGAARERLELEHADRPVPDDRAGRRQDARPASRPFSGPMSRIRSSSATASTGFTVATASALNSRAVTTSTGIGTSAPRAFIGVDHGAGFVDEAGLGQALADAEARCEQEGIGDAATDHQPVDVPRQALQDGELGRHLAAGDDGHERPCRPGERPGDGVDLGGEQRAGAGDRRELGDAVGRRFGPVRGAERVVDEDVAQRRHLPGQGRIVLLLAPVQAAVLEQHQFAGPTSTPSTQPVSQRHLAARAARRGAPRRARACPRAGARLRSDGRGARSP